AVSRQRYGPEELDGPDRRQGQAGNGLVEAGVHRGEDQPEADNPPSVVGREGNKITPGPTPQGKDRRGAGDPEPGGAEGRNLGKQQHGEGRAEIVEDRTDEEEEVRG